MTVATIVIWDREPAYETPARKTFNVNWDGDLLRADFTVDVDPNFLLLPLGGSYINKIVLNGTEVAFIGDRNDVVTFSGKPYLRRGANVIEIHHNALSIPGIQTAGIYAYVSVEAAGSVGGGVTEPPRFDIPIWVWLFLIVVMVLVVIRR